MWREADTRTRRPSHRYPPRRQTNGSNSTAHVHQPPNMANAKPTSRRRAHRAGVGMKGASAEDVDVELLKAVAQAWYAHSGNPRPSRASAAPGDVDEVAGVGARRGGGGAVPRYRPSRFKLEAAAAAAAPPQSRKSWDFAQSLWDTYELVTVAQKIESSLVIADQLAAAVPRAGAEDGATRGGGGKRARESRRSLRSMFLRSSPRKLEQSSS